jgi:hypothetical protein
MKEKKTDRREKREESDESCLFREIETFSELHVSCLT